MDKDDSDKSFRDKVRKCYVDILNREPGIEEISNHIQWMADNNISLKELPGIFKGSEEYLQKNKSIDQSVSEITVNVSGHTFYLDSKDTPLVQSHTQRKPYDLPGQKSRPR